MSSPAICRVQRDHRGRARPVALLGDERLARDPGLDQGSAGRDEGVGADGCRDHPERGPVAACEGSPRGRDGGRTVPHPDPGGAGGAAAEAGQVLTGRLDTGLWGRAPTPRLQRMHGQGASGKGRRLRRACPVAGQARKKEHAAPVACNDGICHARLELEGPADPRVSLLVDSPRRRRGLLDRAVLHGLHHLFVLRRGRLRCRRLGFDDLASAQNQSHGQDQPCCRQPAVSASSQAYGSHFPSPVRFRRGRPGDADHYSNFRARLFHEVVTLGFLDPIGSWMVASRIHIHGPRPRVVPPSCVIFLPEALRAEPGSFPPP